MQANSKINFQCGNCKKEFNVDIAMTGKKGKCNNCGSTIIVPMSSYKSPLNNNLQKYSEYKVITVEEGGCGTILAGSSMIPEKKMELKLNNMVSEGWQVVFQIVEKRRFFIFWTRESVIITLGR